MRRIMAGLILLLVSMQVAPVRGQSARYPPLSEYMMTPEAEIALARSAAPENVSAHATVKILAASGFKVAAQGDNGFVCIVMRGWGAPTFTPAPFRDLVYYSKLRAPICFNPVASRTVLPLQELRTKLGMEGKTPDQIQRRWVDRYRSDGEQKKDAQMRVVGIAVAISGILTRKRWDYLRR
jgi:hypothetical protein